MNYLNNNSKTYNQKQTLIHTFIFGYILQKNYIYIERKMCKEK